MRKSKFTGKVPELYLVDIRDDSRLRVDTLKSQEGVFKLIANTAEVDGISIEGIYKYTCGGGLMEMEVAFKSGSLRLYEKDEVFKG